MSTISKSVPSVEHSLQYENNPRESHEIPGDPPDSRIQRTYHNNHYLNGYTVRTDGSSHFFSRFFLAVALTHGSISLFLGGMTGFFDTWRYPTGTSKLAVAAVNLTVQAGTTIFF